MSEQYRNQHTASKFYLRLCMPDVGQKVLQRYDRTDRTWQVKSPSAATVEDFFYSTRNNDGTWNHKVEQDLGDLERRVAPIFKQLVDGHTLDRSDRGYVAYFIAVQIFRVQYIREFVAAENRKFATVDGAIAFLDQGRQVLRRDLNKKQLDELSQQVRERGEGFNVSDKFYTGDILQRAKKHGHTIGDMTWTVCHAPSRSFFITSDNPAFVRSPSRLRAPSIMGLARSDLGVELGFPLSKHSFLVASWKRLPRTHQGSVSRERTHELNRRTVLSATRYIYAPERSDDVERLIQESAGFSLKPPEFLPSNKDEKH